MNKPPRRVALITGCGKPIGIGSATARALASAGACVMVSDIEPRGLADGNESDADTDRSWRGLESLVKQIKAAGGEAAWVCGDVSKEEDAIRMVRETVDRFGRIDILVNNAGAPHGPDRAEIENVPLDAWERVMAINVRGVFLMSRAAVGHMRGQGWGRIINIASAVVKTPLRKRTAYTASKSAVSGFTHALAADLASAGITVNAIAPGSIRTTRALSTTRRNGWNDVEAGLAERAKTIPLRRHGHAEEIAAAIAFLASEGASYVTGQTIYVDGGGVPNDAA